MLKSDNTIFRAVHATTDIQQLQEYRQTMRPPGNVAYIIDNLWEWKRPESYPNRRYSVFASPSVDRALQSAEKNAIAYVVSITGNYKMCQLKGIEDSKYHPDCKKLRKFMLKKLGQKWIDRDLDLKTDAGRLWMPCLRKEEVDALFDEADVLKKIRREIYDAITYWDDVLLVRPGEPISDQKGEIFFEAFDGYRLLPL